MKKRIYFENLDGLRFLCFLSVFMYHSFYTQNISILQDPIYQFIKHKLFVNGNLGVNFFFVLSGFLITYLLIEEKRMNEVVDLKSFWMRRILRIWPLYYFCVFFGFVLFPILKQYFGGDPNEHANPIYFISFLSNFDMIYNARPDASVLSVLWSVAIEEQFYLVWPIIIFLVPLKKLWIPFSVIIGSSLVFRAYNNNGLLNELHTISCISDMTIGAIGAWLVLLNDEFKMRIVSLSKFAISSIYILFVFFFFFRIQFENLGSGFMVFERSIIAILILFIILEQSYSRNSFFKMSSFKTISSLGTISYGLYCFHFIGILIVTTLTRVLGFNTQLWQVLILETILALATSILISKISYKYFESPFLKFKNKFSYITK
jgi:peptidoglycan/LPS O-acetylase OafA/YrhL